MLLVSILAKISDEAALHVAFASSASVDIYTMRYSCAELKKNLTTLLFLPI